MSLRFGHIAAFVVSLCLSTATLWAQAPTQTTFVQAPKDVEDALRARVQEFMQDFVDKKFVQAFELVAEDTRDAYFSSAKAEIKSFSLADVKFYPGLTKAEVITPVERIWSVQGNRVVSNTQWRTAWVLEKGKWCYSWEVLPGTWLTPMGPSAVVEGMGKVASAPQLPPKIDTAALNNALSQIQGNLSFDHDSVQFSSKRASTQTVKLHNAMPGSITLEVAPVSTKGVTAKLDKTVLNAGEDAVLEVRYTPDGGVPGQTLVEVVTSPFPSRIPLQVRFAD